MKRWLAWGAGAMAIAAALAVAMAAALIDTPAAQAEIQRRLAQALGGQVSWESLDIDLLPPRGELRKLRVAIPGKLDAAADEVQVYLRFWPLLRGRAEVSSVSLRKPTVRILASGGKDEAPLDAVTLYRDLMAPAARALQDFAPDMAFRLTDAAVDLAPLELRGLNASLDSGSEGFDLAVSASSNFWKRLSLKGRVAYADLSARANVELAALAADARVPPADLRARLRTDGKTSVDADFDAALGKLAAKGKLLLPAGKPAELAAELDRVDVAEAIGLARKFSNLDVVESAEGRVSAKATAHLGPEWRLHFDVTRSDAAVKLAPLPWKLAAHAARVTVTEKHVHVAGLRGALGNSVFSNVALQVELQGPARLSSASGQAALALEQWFAWLRPQLPLEAIESLSGDADVTLRRLALRFDRAAEADFDAVVTPRKVSAVLKMLPAPVSVTSGSARAGPAQLKLDKVAVAMLDARALVSGGVSFKNSEMELALTEGIVGEKLVRWALERGAVPPRFEPRTPLRFAAPRIAWAPQAPLEVNAGIGFPDGPEVGLALAWQPKLFELRRLAIKDARSDAVLGASLAGERIQAHFSGTLDGRSIATLLRQPLEPDAGVAKGELSLTMDRARPQDSTAEGELLVEALDLTWLAGRKALVQRADLVADGAGVRIVDAQVSLDEQPIRLRGEIRRTAQGPVIEARLESPGVDVERLVPRPDPAAPKKTERSKVWPLPLSGRIDVQSGFVQFQRYRIEPFEGSFALEPERARLEVKEARMCGVSFPLEIEAVPNNITAAARIRMKDQPLESTLRCLTGDTVQITGSADLQAELRSHGRRPDFVRNLTGTAQAEVRDGRVKKFALLGNILSMRSISSVEHLKADGFPYRSMSTRGRFEGGAFVVEEGAFDSDAVRLAVNGRVDLLGADTRLAVLVGLLTRVERVVGAIPLLGDVLGGALTSVPVSVRGDIRDPLVVPLDPRAITNELLGIFERTLKLPGKLALPPEAKPGATPP